MIIALAAGFALVMSLIIPAQSREAFRAIDDCPSCQQLKEVASTCCGSHCCGSDSQESPHPAPCEDDCECPHCPCSAPAVSPSLSAIITHSLEPTFPHGLAVFSPASGLEFQQVNRLPPLPPPRVV